MKLIIAFLLVCTTSLAFANTFNVSPIHVELTPRHATQPLYLTNDNEEPLVIQAQAMRWSQEKSEDLYIPTDELLATPPIFTIPAHKSQIVRVGLRRAFDLNKELSYRLYLTEIPAPNKSGNIGIQMRLRISLPIFVTNEQPLKPALQWSLSQTTEGAPLLKVRNEGNGHAQISGIYIFPSDSEKAITNKTVPAYLLAGNVREWILKTEPGKTIGVNPVRLRAHVNVMDVDELLTPQTQ